MTVADITIYAIHCTIVQYVSKMKWKLFLAFAFKLKYFHFRIKHVPSNQI